MKGLIVSIFLDPFNPSLFMAAIETLSNQGIDKELLFLKYIRQLLDILGRSDILRNIRTTLKLDAWSDLSFQEDKFLPDHLSIHYFDSELQPDEAMYKSVHDRKSILIIDGLLGANFNSETVLVFCNRQGELITQTIPYREVDKL